MNNRRNFLKKLGMVLGVATVAPVLLSSALGKPKNDIIPGDIVTVTLPELPEPVIITLPKKPQPGITYRIINSTENSVTIIST